jgi:hypothetical protein
MRPFTSSRMHVVRKEEKEARLNGFIAAQISALPPAAAGGRLTVIARSCDSPVLKALAAHAEALTAAGVDIRAVVILPVGSADPEVKAFLAGVNCRLGCDVRLLDAHEQLAIGDRVAWIGDCMRREPVKRDAYECYSTDCAETAAYAHRSFERVWSFASLAKSDTALPHPEICRTPAAVELALAALTDGETPPVVSSRH